MKASEALVILEGLDPNQEVTLILAKNTKVGKVGPANGYLPGQANPIWVIGHEQWVPRDPNVYPYANQINCSNAVH